MGGSSSASSSPPCRAGCEGSKPCHRLNAARQLLDLGFTEAQAFIDGNPQHVQTASPRLTLSQPPDGDVRYKSYARIVREETDDGRDAVRFLVDVMQGSLDGFKPHHRLAAAKELLHRGFDDTEPDDPDPGSEPERPHADTPTAPCLATGRSPRPTPMAPSTSATPQTAAATTATTRTTAIAATTTATTRTTSVPPSPSSRRAGRRRRRRCHRRARQPGGRRAAHWWAGRRR